MWFGITSKNESTTIEDRIQLLTNGSQKSWYLHSITPNNETGSCALSHPMAMDNAYIFFADGTFEFDHGSITDDPTCKGDNCCSDLINLVGTWKFTNSQKNLRIVTAHEKNNDSNVLQQVLCSGSIDQLTEEVLKVSQTSSETNIRFTLEFRKTITY